MGIYIFPSFVNLVIKLWLFWYGRASLTGKHRCLGALLVAFFALNLAEFIAFFCIGNEYHTILIVKCYWIAAVFSAAFMLLLADELTLRRIPAGLLTATAVLLALLIAATDRLIAGGTSIGYTVTRIPGEYYWILQIFVLGSVLGSVLLLAYGGLYLPDRQQRRKCTIIFLGFLPIVISVAVVLALMQSGLRINAAIIVSSAITFFLVVLVTAEVRYSLLNLLTLTPVITVRVITQICASLKDIYRDRSISLKYLLQNIESVLILVVLDINDGDRKDTARQLGMHVSSLNKKLQKINEDG